MIKKPWVSIKILDNIDSSDEDNQGKNLLNTVEERISIDPETKFVKGLIRFVVKERNELLAKTFGNLLKHEGKKM
jgi:hypothetical protein